MKIGMMTDLYKPHISGVTSYIELNKRILEEAGHEVYVFTFGGLDYQDDETNIIRSPGIPLFLEGYSFNVQYSTKARRLVRTMDVVHVQHPFVSGSLALLYCKPKGIPIVFTNHTRYDLYAKAYLPIISSVISTATMRGYLPLFCHSIDLVISPSPGMKEVLLKAGVEDQIDVVPNGVDLSPFQHVHNPIQREQLDLTDQDVVLIFVGRLGREKNIAFLFNAFSQVLKECPQAALVLVGSGPESENFKYLAKDLGLEERVRFTGSVNYKDIPRYLKTADAFVTASVTEVHPFTVIEAMASGLPVVGIQSPGIGDTIEHEKTGLLAQSENQTIFIELIQRIIQDRTLRQRLGDQARLVAQNYSLEKTSQMLLERYQLVIDRARSSKKNL